MHPLITKQQSDRYVAHYGAVCPLCGSGMIEGDSLDVEAGEVWQKISCLDCNAEWQDIYRLVECSNEFTRREE